MKILFKQLSLQYVAGKINDNELALKFDNIIQQAIRLNYDYRSP